MRRLRDESGNALIEFIGISVALVIPLTYAVITFAQIQSAVFGITGAAKQAGRAYVRANDDATGRFAAWRAASIAGRNHNLYIDTDEVRITCAIDNCLTPGTKVTIRVQHDVTLPWFGREFPVSATHVSVVDGYRAQTW